MTTTYTYSSNPGYGWLSGYIAPVARATDPARAAAHRADVERSGGFGVLSANGAMTGYDKAPPPCPGTYWQMRKYSACALAYAVSAGPVFAATRTAVIRSADGSEDAPATVPTGSGAQVTQTPEQKRRKLVDDAFESLWADILCGLECLNFGNWLQEVIWDARPELGGVTGPVRFKSFLPGEAVLTRDRFGDFAGFRYARNQERDARYAFNAVCSEHFDPIFGVPRAENARVPWWRACQCQDNADRIEKKASGIHMLLEMMNGQTFTDPDGTPVISRAAGQRVVDAMASGRTAVVPSTPFGKDDIKNNPDLAKIKAVTATQFDWGETGPSLLAAIARLNRLDVEIMRSWHRPEREALEGLHGTKAEAGEHGDVGLVDSELIHGNFLRQFNRQVVNRFLVTNFGPEAADTIYFRPAPLSDPARDFKQQVALALMSEPETNGNLDRRRLAKETQLPLVPEAVARKNIEAAAERADEMMRAKAGGVNGNRFAGANGNARE